LDIGYRFGHRKTGELTPPRTGTDYFPKDGMLPAQGPLSPNGASTTCDVNLTNLRGPYYELPAGTKLPPGMKILRDGRDVIPDSNRGAGHHTIYNDRDMLQEVFDRLFMNLPGREAGSK
jgi:hypothetical protein